MLVSCKGEAFVEMSSYTKKLKRQWLSTNNWHNRRNICGMPGKRRYGTMNIVVKGCGCALISPSILGNRHSIVTLLVKVARHWNIKTI